MAILIVHQGADWNQDLYDQARERLIPDPSDLPDGMVIHFAGPGQNGGWKVAEVWDSEAKWASFRDEQLIPTAQDMQAPPFDTDAGELHNQIGG